MIASELGLDPTIARRAGLLHDLGKALDHEIEGSHVDIGVDVAADIKRERLWFTPFTPIMATWRRKP